MSEWREYNVGELIKKNILSIGDGYRAKNLELSASKDDGLPFARAGNVNGGFDFSDADYFPHQNLQKVGEKVSKLGDTVFTSKGTVGRFAFVNDKSAKFVYSPQLCYWRSLDEKVISPRYLFYWMQGREFFEQANAVKSQTDMADYVNLFDQRRMMITLPLIDEQKAIEESLSSLDDKIDLLHRQNKTLEHLAETLFRQWFVEKAEESWEEKSLDEIAEYLNGLALQKFPAKGNDSLPVIKIKEMKQGISENTDRCSREMPSKYIIQDGDILFSWSGSLEVVIWHDGEGALNQHLFKVSSNSFPKWFYYLATKYHLETFKMIAESKSTTMGHIQREHLSDATISVPPKEIFAEYDKQIAPLIEKRIKNNSQIKNLIQLRDTLLPKLMSGEVRVNN